jgi:hypothetical protein
MPSNVISTENEMLDVRLSDRELKDRGESLANIFGRLEEIQAEEAAHRAAFKEKRELLEKNMATLSGFIRRRAEPRPTTVEWRADYKRNIAERVRTDTEEVLEHRALTTEEMQAPLFPVRGGRKTADAGEP